MTYPRFSVRKLYLSKYSGKHYYILLKIYCFSHAAYVCPPYWSVPVWTEQLRDRPVPKQDGGPLSACTESFDLHMSRREYFLAPSFTCFTRLFWCNPKTLNWVFRTLRLQSTILQEWPWGNFKYQGLGLYVSL